ncbi:TetR/AcrR family transcriptional regulator [Nocardia gipuzkoensis]
MAVNQVGRPSKAAERRMQILLAMATVVAQEGLSEVTVGKVAAEAGLQRTLVFHYFGDRAALIEAFLDEAVGLYGEVMLLGEPDKPFEERLDLAFAQGFYERREDLVVWIEIVALAARDDKVRDRLRRLWLERWLAQVEHQLHEQRPAATPEQISDVGYALAMLVEAHWAFQLQGIDAPERTTQAQQAARALFHTLPTE